jgi:lipoate-protein ligase B
MKSASATDNGRRTTDPCRWFCLELDRLDYTEALALQHRLVSARKTGALDRNVVMLLEHPPVYTLGRRGGRENLRVSEAFLERSGIRVIQVERGGNITYHGPGQLVAYPIFDLDAARLSVTDYVFNLETVMLRTARQWGVAADRNDANRGIWVGPNKMGSIGIAIHRGVTYHGLALNVNPSLEPFSWINPCGLQGVGVTSMQQEAARIVNMAEVRRAFKNGFQEVFGIALEAIALEDLETLPV